MAIRLKAWKSMAGRRFTLPTFRPRKNSKGLRTKRIPALKARYLRLARSFRHLALIVSPREPAAAAPQALATDAAPDAIA
jgi:hypothetical protein